MNHQSSSPIRYGVEPHGWFPSIGEDWRSAESAGRSFEARGVSLVWIPEAGHDPFLAAAALAAGTDRLRVGTGVAVAYARTPLATAQAAWDLQRMSGGRFVLGLGTQVRAHVERRYGTRWPGGAAALREYVECCRAIWSCWQRGGPPAYEGRHFQFTLSNPAFEPSRLPDEHADIPVWLGTVGPRLARVVGEVADGFYAHAFHTPDYLRQVLRPALEAGARDSGRAAPVGASSTVFGGIVYDASQEATLRDAFRARLAFYGSTPTYAPVLEHAGFADLRAALGDLARARQWAKMAALIPDEMVEAFAIFDEPRALGRRLAQRYRGLLTGLTLYPGADRFADPEALQDFAEALRAG